MAAQPSVGPATTCNLRFDIGPLLPVNGGAVIAQRTSITNGTVITSPSRLN